MCSGRDKILPKLWHKSAQSCQWKKNVAKVFITIYTRYHAFIEMYHKFDPLVCWIKFICLIKKYTLKVNWYISTEAGQFVDKHVIQFLCFFSKWAGSWACAEFIWRYTCILNSRLFCNSLRRNPLGNQNLNWWMINMG